jgi:pilus assembly protein Flp/PilA
MLSYLTYSLIAFARREDGAAAVEYAVLLALIAVVCITSITTLGTRSNSTFTRVSNALVSAS